MRRRIAACLVALAAAGPASASTLIDRNAANARLEVDAHGYALVSYSAAGRQRNVLAWDAVNALAPTASRPQVAFRLDYSGGWGTFRRDYWRTFRNVCRPYTGPPLAWFVVACTAPDGSYWALQSWQRMLPDYGLAPAPAQAVWELRLSHWTGALPVLTVEFGWAYRRFQQIFGTLTYDGRAVYGFHSTSSGSPLDAFGRNIYVDTFDSAYGSGWRRENSFLVHRPTGGFCYGFYPHGSRPSGHGSAYRATVIGPGVTPDVTWQGAAPRVYTRAADRRGNDAMRALLSADPLCRPH